MPNASTTSRDTAACTAAELRDAYLAIGSAISDLRSMPMLRGGGLEEGFRVQNAAQSLGEAQHLLRHARMPETQIPITVSVEASKLHGLRAVARPLVWGWIAGLQRTRTQVAALMVQRGEPVPDDLPEGSWLEKAGGSRKAQLAFMILAAVLFALWIAAIMDVALPWSSSRP